MGNALSLSHYEAGIDSPRQERRDLDIGNEMRRYGTFERDSSSRDHLRGVRRASGRPRPLVERSLFFDTSVHVNREHMSGGQRSNILERGPGLWDLVEAEVLCKRLQVDGPLGSSRQHRLNRGCKSPAAANPGDVHRLDPESIAGQEDTPTLRIVKRERIHPVNVAKEIVTVVLVQVNEHLSVARRCKGMSPLGEHRSQRAVIVDLPIEYAPYGAPLVPDGLIARTEIDDGEARVQ